MSERNTSRRSLTATIRMTLHYEGCDPRVHGLCDDPELCEILADVLRARLAPGALFPTGIELQIEAVEVTAGALERS